MLPVPYQLIRTPLNWDDLVLAQETMDAVDRVRHAIVLNKNSLNRGYCSLFVGKPGVGKTLTTALMGKSLAIDVCRVDLSQLTHRQLDELKLTLLPVFEQASFRNWVLFFEGVYDLLCGPAASIASIFELLKTYPCIVILSSKLSVGVGDEVTQPFQAVVTFPMPDASQRLRLWQASLNAPFQIAEDVVLASIAQEYELSGGSIANVVRCVSIQLAKESRQCIQLKDIKSAIAHELSRHES
jgi:SpoVK/Ycf46/Vps4 family AAA+-type ATPase